MKHLEGVFKSRRSVHHVYQEVQLVCIMTKIQLIGCKARHSKAYTWLIKW